MGPWGTQGIKFGPPGSLGNKIRALRAPWNILVNSRLRPRSSPVSLRKEKVRKKALKEMHRKEKVKSDDPKKGLGHNVRKLKDNYARQGAE